MQRSVEVLVMLCQKWRRFLQAVVRYPFYRTDRLQKVESDQVGPSSAGKIIDITE